VVGAEIGGRKQLTKPVTGSPTASLHKRADDVMALKKQGVGLRAISREHSRCQSHPFIPS